MNLIQFLVIFLINGIDLSHQTEIINNGVSNVNFSEVTETSTLSSLFAPPNSSLKFQNSIDSCVSQKLRELPVNLNVIESIRHYNKARELARYLCSSNDMDRELREQFNEIIRGQTMTWRQVMCFKSFLLYINVTGPLVDTFANNLHGHYENDVDCQMEIDKIKAKTLNETSSDGCDDDSRFPMEIYLKIAVIASGNYNNEIKRAERDIYKSFLRKLREKRLACVFAMTKAGN